MIPGDLILVENFDDVKIRDLCLVVEVRLENQTVKVFDVKRQKLDVWGMRTLENYTREIFRKPSVQNPVFP